MSTSFDKRSGRGCNWWLIGGGCLLLFACLCVTAILGVFFLPDNTLAQIKQLTGLGGGASASVEYVPTSAPLFIVANPSAAQAANAKKVIDILGKNPVIRQRLDEVAAQSSSGADFNFDRDVAPWIGTEIGIALFDVPSAQSSSASSIPTFVVFAPTRDKAKSDEALARIRKAAEAKGTTFTEEKYKDATLVIGQAKPSGNRQSDQPTVYTTFQGMVMLANSADGLKKALDTKQGGDKVNLGGSDKYKAIVSKLPKDRAATFVADLGALVTSAGNTTARTPGADSLAALDGIGFSLGFTDDGIRLDTVVTFDVTKLPASSQKLFAAIKANPNKILDALPATSVAEISGQDLKSLWDYYSEILAQDPQTKKQFDQGLQDIKKQSGIDVNEDVFGWMTGEYAVGIVPAKPLSAIGTSAPAAGLLLLFEAKDQNLVTTKMQKIATALGQNGIKLATRKVNGVDMQVVTGLEAQGITAGYGFVGNFLAIGSGDDVLSAAVGAPQSPLSKEPEFQFGAKLVPQPNSGVAYFSVPRLIELVKSALPQTSVADFEKNSEPALRPFKSIGLGSSLPKDGVTTSVIFIHVAE